MKINILLVEDDINISFNMKILLEFNNYQVTTATNGIDALNILKNLTTPPDLILCDITMPRMGGYEFRRELLENPVWVNIPFIFVTATIIQNINRFDKELNVKDYVIKPFKEEDLLEIIFRNLNSKQKSSD